MKLRSPFPPPAILATSIATLTASLLLATSPHSLAASASWLAAPADGNWEPAVGPNWSTGTNTFPGATSGSASTDVATFNVASSISNIVINNGAPSLNIGGITFTGAAGNYFIGTAFGESIVLTNGGTIQIDNALTASNALEAVGAPLVLAGATYSVLNNSANGSGAGVGTLALAGAISGGNSGATTLTLAGSNTNANLVLGAISDGTSTSVSLVKDGPGTWVIHPSTNNTYTGTTTINDGTLVLGGSAAQQLGTGVVTIGDGTGAAGSAVLRNQFNNVLADTQALVLNSDGAYQLQGFKETVGSIASASAASQVSLAGGTLTTGDATNTTFAGSIAGAGALVKQGTGTWTLSGINTYTASTTVNAGILKAGSTQALSLNSAFTINTPGQLDLAGFNSSIGSLAGNGAVISSAGLPNFTLGNDGTSTSYSGTITGLAALIKVGGGTQTFVGVSVTGPGLNQFTVDGGTMALTAGSTVGVFGGGTVIGTAAGKTGILSLDNSTLTSLFLAVGQGGTGTLILQNHSSAGASNVFIGQLPGSTGTLTMTNSNIPLATSFNVGYGGTGTANLLAGASVNATNVNVGTQAGSTGLLNIDAGTLNASGIVNVGTGGATGTLRLTDGGVLNAPTVNVGAGGAVEIGGSYSLTTPAANLIFNGGTLRALATASFTNNATIGANGITLDSAGSTGTLQGILSGSGSLTKTGLGKWIIEGAQQYTGNTTINGGVLAVNGSILSPEVLVNSLGTLAGSGTIFGNVTNHGLVAPGNSPGTLTVKGNYTQASDGVLGIEIASAQSYDRLVVGGHASIGGTLAVAFFGFTPKRGDTFTFLTATGGVDGTFSHILGNRRFGMLNFDVTQSGNSLVLSAESAPILPVFSSLSPNQRSTAGALDGAMQDPRMSKVFDYLASRAPNQIPGDLDRIAPEELTSFFTIGLAYAEVQAGNFQRRTDAIRSGTSGFTAAGLAINGAGPSYSGAFGSAGPVGPITPILPIPPTSGDGKEVKETRPVAPADNRWGVFLSGTGEWVNVGDTNNARGYNLNSGGFTLGVDYKVTPNFAIGIAAGYTGTTADLTEHGRVWVNGGKLGVYATAFAGGWYADIAGFGGYNSYDTRRSALQGQARGDTDGGEIDGLVGTGFDFRMGGLTFGPTASFNYTYMGTNGFTEHGSLLPLSVHGGQGESVRTALGVKASYDWKIGGVVIRPEVRAAWQHEFGDTAYALDANFANGAGNSFLVNGPRLGRDSALLGAGFAIQFNDRVSTYFYYDGELGRENYESNSVTGGVRVAF